jgi:hypothetical protein
MVRVAPQKFLSELLDPTYFGNDEGTVHEDNIVDIATIFSTKIVVEMAYFDGDLL